MAGEITKEMMSGAKESAKPLEGDLVVVGNKYPIQVRITDIKMPFMSMVTFMVKWAVAAIPAILILLVIGALLSGLVAGLFVHR